MGIVSSTFASLAIQFAWNCQRFLDPRYRYIEPCGTKNNDDNMATAPEDEQMAINRSELDDGAPAGLTSRLTDSTICHPAENNNSLHQQNRRRRATQHRYRKRPSSFDVSLIIRNKNKSCNTGLVTTSTPSTLMRQPAPCWDTTSSSSTDSSDSEIEFMYGPGGNLSNTERNKDKNESEGVESRGSEVMEARSNEEPEVWAMSAAEEAAFRVTIGRGHFSRSKKDRFLNHLRLEKRLNGLNKEFFEMARRAHTRSLRRHSGDLRSID